MSEISEGTRLIIGAVRLNSSASLGLRQDDLAAFFYYNKRFVDEVPLTEPHDVCIHIKKINANDIVRIAI